MSRSDQKVVQYLNEAHASEVGLVSVLKSQIAMTRRAAERRASGDCSCGGGPMTTARFPAETLTRP